MIGRTISAVSGTRTPPPPALRPGGSWCAAVHPRPRRDIALALRPGANQYTRECDFARLQAGFRRVRACVIPVDLAINHIMIDEMSEPVARAFLDGLALCGEKTSRTYGFTILTDFFHRATGRFGMYDEPARPPRLPASSARFRRGAGTRNCPAIRSSPHRNSSIPIPNASRHGTKRKTGSCALTKGVAMVRPIRILLVEDEYIIQISLNNALVEAGFEVSDVARGVMAIAELGRIPLDLECSSQTSISAAVSMVGR